MQKELYTMTKQDVFQTCKASEHSKFNQYGTSHLYAKEEKSYGYMN